MQEILNDSIATGRVLRSLYDIQSPNFFVFRMLNRNCLNVYNCMFGKRRKFYFRKYLEFAVVQDCEHILETVNFRLYGWIMHKAIQFNKPKIAEFLIHHDYVVGTADSIDMLRLSRYRIMKTCGVLEFAISHPEMLLPRNQAFCKEAQKLLDYYLCKCSLQDLIDHTINSVDYSECVQALQYAKLNSCGPQCIRTEFRFGNLLVLHELRYFHPEEQQK